MWFILFLFLCGAPNLYGQPILEATALWRSLYEHPLLSLQQKTNFLASTQVVDSFMHDTTDEVLSALLPAWTACVDCLAGTDGNALTQLCLAVAELRRQADLALSAALLDQGTYVKLQVIGEWGRSLVAALCVDDASDRQVLGSVRDTNRKESIKHTVLYVGGAVIACVVGGACLWIAYRSRHSQKNERLTTMTHFSGTYSAVSPGGDASCVRDECHQAFTLLPSDALARLQQEDGLVVHDLNTGTGGMVIEKPSPELRDKLMREASCAHLSADDALHVRKGEQAVRAAATAKPLEEAEVVTLLTREEILAPLVSHVIGGRGPDSAAVLLRSLMDDKVDDVRTIFVEELVAFCGTSMQSFMTDRRQEHAPVAGFMGKRSRDSHVLAVATFIKGNKTPLNAVLHLMRADKAQQHRCAYIIIKSLAAMLMEQQGIDEAAAHRALIGTLWPRKKYRKMLRKWHKRMSLASDSTNDDAGGAPPSNDRPPADVKLTNDEALLSKTTETLLSNNEKK